MTLIERIDADLFWFYPRLSAPVRVIRVLLTPSLPHIALLKTLARVINEEVGIEGLETDGYRRAA